MKGEKERLEDLQPADLDEVSGGLFPAIAAGAAIGAGAYWLYDNYGRSRPNNVTPNSRMSRCWGTDGVSGFRVQSCDK